MGMIDDVQPDAVVGESGCQCERCRHGREAAAFIAHLEKAAVIVATWPKWKRDVLGARLSADVAELEAVGESADSRLAKPKGQPE